MAITSSRRSFLKVGLFGAIALATAGGVYRITRPPQTPGPFIMDDAARSVLAAVIPVMLKDTVTSPADVEAAIGRAVDAIHGLPLFTQNEVKDLFALLALGPSRRLLAGVPDEWSQANSADIAAFLQDWRYSRIALFQGAYLGLHDLVTGSWYSHETTWAAIGYPGPAREFT